MCFCIFFLEAYTGGYMKKYANISIGVVVLLVVLYGGQLLMKERPEAGISNVEAAVGMMSISGQVTRVFEGENVINYMLDIPETATTSVSMDGALIRITDTANPLVSIYFSYEGGRGYRPMDYINNTIAPHVPVITPTSTSTIGAYEWQKAESDISEWHLASVLDGNWLIVVENKKTAHEAVERTLESLKVN
jgi:hypothetical protein